MASRLRKRALALVCPDRLRVLTSRAFGANFGDNVLIGHRVRIHWPWKLTVGDDTWIGEGAWIPNLEPVVIGANVCTSQDALLCTGSHRLASSSFEFDNAPIPIGDQACVRARAMVLRGVNLGSGFVRAANSVMREDAAPGSFHVAVNSEV